MPIMLVTLDTSHLSNRRLNEDAPQNMPHTDEPNAPLSLIRTCDNGVHRLPVAVALRESVRVLVLATINGVLQILSQSKKTVLKLV